MVPVVWVLSVWEDLIGTRIQFLLPCAEGVKISLNPALSFVQILAGCCQNFKPNQHNLEFGVQPETFKGNAAFVRWWGVGVFPILDTFRGPRSNPLHFLVTSPSISLNGSRRQ